MAPCDTSALSSYLISRHDYSSDFGWFCEFRVAWLPRGEIERPENATLKAKRAFLAETWTRASSQKNNRFHSAGFRQELLLLFGACADHRCARNTKHAGVRFLFFFSPNFLATFRDLHRLENSVQMRHVSAATSVFFQQALNDQLYELLFFAPLNVRGRRSAGSKRARTALKWRHILPLFLGKPAKSGIALKINKVWSDLRHEARRNARKRYLIAQERNKLRRR